MCAVGPGVDLVVP